MFNIFWTREFFTKTSEATVSNDLLLKPNGASHLHVFVFYTYIITKLWVFNRFLFALPRQGCKLSTQMCLSDTHSRQLKDLGPSLTFDLTVPARCNLYDDVEWYDVTYRYIWSQLNWKPLDWNMRGHFATCKLMINYAFTKNWAETQMPQVSFNVIKVYLNCTR